MGALLNDIGPGLNEFLGKSLSDADISVDARYGEWSAAEGRIVDGEASTGPTTTTPADDPLSSPTTAG